MAEWYTATDLKSVVLYGHVSSNLTRGTLIVCIYRRIGIVNRLRPCACYRRGGSTPLRCTFEIGFVV